MVKRYILLILLSLFVGSVFTSNLNGQYYNNEDQPELPGRVFIAPDFSLVIGNLTRIEFSPIVGYHLTPRLIAGIGGRFEYYREKNYLTSNVDIQTMIYGYRLFSRFILVKDINEIIPLNVPMGIFAHAEFESLSLEEKYFRLGYSNSEDRYWLNSVLAGVGINQPTGPRSSINVMVLWDLTSTASAPFSYPVLKFGLQFYL